MKLHTIYEIFFSLFIIFKILTVWNKKLYILSFKWQKNKSKIKFCSGTWNLKKKVNLFKMWSYSTTKLVSLKFNDSKSFLHNSYNLFKTNSFINSLMVYAKQIFYSFMYSFVFALLCILTYLWDYHNLIFKTNIWRNSIVFYYELELTTF